MLRKLTIAGFKAFSESTIRLQPFTVLIGPNGAGKSTILQAVDLLEWMVTRTLDQCLEMKGWEFSDLPHLRSPKGRVQIQAELELGGQLVRWLLTLSQQPHKKTRIDERVSRLDRDQWTDLMRRDDRDMERLDVRSGAWERVTQAMASSWLATVDERDGERFPELLRIARWARGIRGYFFLDPERLRAPSRGEVDEIGFHGEQLASFVALLHRHRREAFDRLKARVRQYYPRLEDIHPRRKKFGWTHLDITERWGADSVRLNARQASDGLLRLIAVAAMQERQEPATVQLLDEIENGIHPHLLGGFVQMLREYVESRRGQTQVILATHSPITVNYCERAEEVILVSRNERGAPVCRPMSATRDLDELRPHFDLGELWYNLGEERLM